MPHKEVTGVETINPRRFGGMCSRAIAMGKREFDFEKGIETIATTDAPALVIDWDRWEVVREILPMKYAELPATDKVPLLDSHSRFAVEQIKGSAVNFRTTETQLLCKTLVSEVEVDVRKKIQEGHLDSVSVGYMTDPEFSVEVPKKATVMIDGAMYKNEYEDDYPLIVRTWWKTKELSLVAIGADEAAKFKAAGSVTDKKILDEINSLREEIKQLKGTTPTGKSKALYERKLKRILSDINN